LHSPWARKLDIAEPAAAPWILGAKLFAVRAARFAVYATKFPVPYVGNSSKQASLFNGFDRGEDACSAKFPVFSQGSRNLTNGEQFAADCQHSHLVAGFLALSRPSEIAHLVYFDPLQG
jgi:hypothetical protein